MQRLGAVPRGDGTADVRVWAPGAGSVAVRAEQEVALEQEGECWLGRFSGDDYLLVVDGEEWPDPCSRWQPEGVTGPSRVLDTGAFEWSDDGWGGLRRDELVIYKLHVGTFSEEGTLEGIVPRLRALRALGVTAIELMPVATFPGERGWGYDGLYTYAAHPAYGGPAGLARLVDAAHGEGLGVILDVVYNHVGPGDEALRAFGPYFTGRHETFWGDALDYAQRGAREWAIQNAEQWVRDFHVDGLRLDAVHTIFDDSPLHVCAELKQRVGPTLVISEMELGDWRPIEEWGHDAQWFDATHHELHVLLTGERDGYYASFGSVERLAEELRGCGRDPRRFVVCAQNHDQVGNRALGDRLPEEALRVAAAVTLFSACTPLLFMGEEYFEQAPFQFFTDHIDPAIAAATREGRRREFADFAAFDADEVPDPQALETFLRSKLRPREPDPLYRELLALRRELPRDLEAEADEKAKVLRLRRGGATLVADFGNRRVELSRG
ncbi:MAG TPA: alpha-amylase family glycosyl hydrolase [Gaiellaceae bacterium]|nr:alpha-amylase family glycosyl hydrolase [Gaiellaceae bacterium]